MSTGNGSGDALLATDHVTKAFGGLVAVEDVSFVVKPRSIVSIIGPNGAGKTTFFNMLTGLYRPSQGTITFSVAVIELNRRMFWNVRATPRAVMMSGRVPVTSVPPNTIRPTVGL